MKLKLTLVALALTSIPVGAATLTYNPANSATGNYSGQSFTANDSGFVVTGDPLTSSYSLLSVEFAKWSTTGYTVAQEAVYVNVYDGGTFLGSSTNTVNWKLNVDGIIGDDAGDEYDFTGVAGLQNLSSSTQYQMYFSTTNVAGDFITVRPGVSTPNNLSGGNLLNSSGGTVDSAYDSRFVMTTGPAIPEPSAALLAGLGTLCLRRRRRQLNR